MLSPKNDFSQFSIDLDFTNNWLHDFPETQQILENAPYKVSALIDEFYNLTFEYEFVLLNNPAVGSRKISTESADERDRLKTQRNIRGELRPFFRATLDRKQYDQEVIDHMIEKIESDKIPFGKLMLEMYSFDLDPASPFRDSTTSPHPCKGFAEGSCGNQGVQR